MNALVLEETLLESIAKIAVYARKQPLECVGNYVSYSCAGTCEDSCDCSCSSSCTSCTGTCDGTMHSGCVYY